MLDENTPIPTPVTKENLKTIGVYEGAGYLNKEFTDLILVVK